MPVQHSEVRIDNTNSLEAMLLTSDSTSHLQTAAQPQLKLLAPSHQSNGARYSSLSSSISHI